MFRLGLTSFRTISRQYPKGNYGYSLNQLNNTNSRVASSSYLSSKRFFCSTSEDAKKLLSNDVPDITSEEQTPKHVEELADQIVNLSLMDTMSLNKALCKRFGVDLAMMMGGGGGGGFAAPVAAAPVAAAAPVEEAEPEPAGPKTFDIKLKSVEGGVKAKFAIMKIIRALFPDLSLQECKKMTDELPSVIKEDANEEEKEDILTKLKEAGGDVEVTEK